MSALDTSNRFLVSRRGEQVVIMGLPPLPRSTFPHARLALAIDDAANLAAWLTEISDPARVEQIRKEIKR